MKKIACFIILASSLIGYTSCKDKNIDLAAPPLATYWNPAVGKWIIYRLDSTVTANFGAGLLVRSYRVKDSIDAQVTDALGRKAYRVIRTITDTAGTNPYKNNATFLIVPQGTDWMELVDNNLRYMRLRFPIRDGFSWKGHSFIDATSINSTVRYLADWNYTYQSVQQPYTVRGIKFDSTVTILQRDETIPEGPFSDKAYKQRNYGVEIYGKGVGLIYKEFLHYIYQPPTYDSSRVPPALIRNGYYEDESYGVKLQIISHN